jgi:two-component system, OmpR family, sensor kinase
MRVPTPGRVLPRTLRSRLIAGLLTLLIAACAAVGLVTYLAVRDSLSDALNNDLQTATNLAYACHGPNPANDQGITGRPGPGGGPGGAGGPNPNAAPPATGNSLPTTSRLRMCQGLAEGTYVAVLGHTKGTATLIGNISYKLSPADEKSLRSIPPSKVAGPRTEPGSQHIPTADRDLSDAGGAFLLTAVSPPGGGAVYITGLPLSTLHDTLGRVALAEAAVFAAVLLLAGAGGTLWVRFSLRPLRRVAATASQVAELPLDSDEVELPAGVPDTDPATETGQVGLAFNRMLGHVQTALRRRAASEARLRRFAADASHELRTPLSAIRGYAELALRHPGDSPEQVTHALGRVLSESTRMSVLVDELLLLARLDAGRPLATEPVDMTRLVIDATSDAQVARPGHRWVLELPDDPVLVTGDEHRLHQVLANILSNAGKHTPDGATVTVRVGDTPPDAAALLGDTPPGAAAGQTVRRGVLPPAPRLVVSVTDNGPGIPPDLLPDLFERFTRADTARSRTSSASSTGLGLAIVDAVVAAHGGAVLVTSRPGLTSFAIALPRLTEPTWPPSPAPVEQRRPQPTRKP